jgi:hypothetical protein
MANLSEAKFSDAKANEQTVWLDGPPTGVIGEPFWRVLISLGSWGRGKGRLVGYSREDARVNSLRPQRARLRDDADRACSVARRCSAHSGLLRATRHMTGALFRTSFTLMGRASCALRGPAARVGRLTERPSRVVANATGRDRPRAARRCISVSHPTSAMFSRCSTIRSACRSTVSTLTPAEAVDQVRRQEWNARSKSKTPGSKWVKRGFWSIRR